MLQYLLCRMPEAFLNTAVISKMYRRQLDKTDFFCQRKMILDVDNLSCWVEAVIDSPVLGQQHSPLGLSGGFKTLILIKK